MAQYYLLSLTRIYNDAEEAVKENLTGNINFTVIDGLFPYTLYTVSIAAVNGAGTSPVSNQTEPVRTREEG